MIMGFPEIRKESNGGLVSGIAIGFAVAASIFVALRLYTRLRLLKSAGKEDWTILVATVSKSLPDGTGWVLI